MQNRTSGPYVSPVFSPPPYAVAVNALFFASLGIVLVAAFLCMLVKGWIRELDRKLLGIPDLKKRAVIKELREQGLARWRLPEIIIILPSLIHISLVLFFIGLALYLLQVHPLPAFLSISIFGLCVLVYFLSIVISAVDDFAPFRSMYSRVLGVLYRRLYPDLMPALVSRSALSQTTVERIRERMSTFIIQYKPLSEQGILEPASYPLKQLISNTSVTIFNKIWSPVSKRRTSADAKNISTSILLQLDVSHLRPSHHLRFPLPYESSNPSIREAEGLAYSVCMMRPEWVHRDFVRSTRAVIDVLQQSSDPWHRLVALLTSVWVECAEQIFSSKPGITSSWLEKLSITGRKEDILHAISMNIIIFSVEQWCFVLSSIYSLFILDNGGLDSKEVRALIEILVRLLQAGVYVIQGDPSVRTDFWLYVTMSVLEDAAGVQHNTPISKLTSSGWVLDARDISAYGNGMTRDPKYIRRLLQLSREQNLNQSLMRKSLVLILYILISFEPSTEQRIRLVHHYMEIIEEEMDMIDWSLYLSGLLNNENFYVFFMSQTVLCLLSGRYPHSPDGYGFVEAARTIMGMYDLKLSAANTQPTPSILKVLDNVVSPWFVTGLQLELQSSWLSLYACNLTHLPHSGIPFTWSPGCISIASRRLDLYDSGDVAPEMDLIISFLSCPSIPTACQALRWYLRLKENSLTSGDTQYVTTIFPTIFHKGLSPDENQMTWLLLVDVLLPSLGSMSLQEKAYFAENFFGYGSWQGNNQAEQDQSMMSLRAGDEDIPDAVDMPTATVTLQADGLGWLEDVWVTVLQPPVVHIDCPGTYWSELARVMHSTCPEPAQLTELTSPTPGVARNEAPEGTTSKGRPVLGPQTLKEHLEDSAQRVLEVLAQLFESGTGMVPAELLDRVGNSPLLSDKRLQDDSKSLNCIRGILNQGVQS